MVVMLYAIVLCDCGVVMLVRWYVGTLVVLYV